MLQGNMSEFSEKPVVTILRPCPPDSLSFQFFWPEPQLLAKAHMPRKTCISGSHAQPVGARKLAFWQSADSADGRTNPAHNS